MAYRELLVKLCVHFRTVCLLFCNATIVTIVLVPSTTTVTPQRPAVIPLGRGAEVWRGRALDQVADPKRLVVTCSST